MIAVEYIEAWGHPLIRAEHKTTFEITRESYLTPRGDCIIGIRADKAARDLSRTFRELISYDDTRITVFIVTSVAVERIECRGGLRKLLNPSSMVFRRSSYVDDRTVGIKCNKAAGDLSRKLVKHLQRASKLRIILVAVRENF